ncbi:MAG: hypothetical protein IPJ38_00770 [Dechloromonas sp.]|uniref:Uncharacterized protein n=1 Tax=Candidatus Dechloromonas phosphorivorans TaxID=2899244 RepID=A0A935MUM2_9RHOO|nr:hypothetical protein [Candidatus Dechloromonas phosphorivorans]
MMTIANNDETCSKSEVARFLAPETSTEQFSVTLYAQPYNRDAQGFYFHDAEEFVTNLKTFGTASVARLRNSKFSLLMVKMRNCLKHAELISATWRAGLT